MSRALSWISIVFAAAALIIAFTANPASAPSSDATAVTERDLHAIRDRLDLLEASVADLESRLDNRPTAQGQPPVAAHAVPAAMPGASDREVLAQLNDLRRELKELREARSTRSPESQEELKSAIASAQREMMNDRFRQHQERMATHRRESLERFIESQGLSGAQADDLRRVIEDDMRAMQEAMESLRDREMPPSPAERQQFIETRRESMRQALGQILNEEQIAAFESEVMPPGRAVRPPPPMRVGP